MKKKIEKKHFFSRVVLREQKKGVYLHPQKERKEEQKVVQKAWSGSSVG